MTYLQIIMVTIDILMKLLTMCNTPKLKQFDTKYFLRVRKTPGKFNLGLNVIADDAHRVVLTHRKFNP